jgi:putative ABC transport system permease protein
VLRRRAQTATVLVISLLAASVSTMALTLLARSTLPWDEAFAKVEGPHLLFHLDASRVTADQLRATESLPGVTAAGPPRPTAVVPFAWGDRKGSLQVIGRATAGGAFDRQLLAAGRWPQRSGEIAVTRLPDLASPFRPKVGDTVRALTSHGTPEFRVVGEVIPVILHGVDGAYANSIVAAWVPPDDIDALVDGREIRLGYEMAYRFARAATSDQLAADKREVEAALPANAEAFPARDWLDMRRSSVLLISLLSSIIFAFTVFALVAVAVIVGSVVAGSVLSSYREIGIAKALGFTPAQVVAVYVGQMLAPAAAGSLLGIPLGAAASRPFLDDASNALSLPPSAVFDPLVAVAVAAGVVMLAIIAALVPALRAGATNSLRAITLGTAPPGARRSRLAAVLARLRAPRPLSLGAGDAFARPVRALLTLTALGIGVATVTFAIGFQDTFSTFLVREPATYTNSQDVGVQRYPGISDGDVMSTLAAQPETQAVVAMRAMSVRLPDVAEPAPAQAMRGDAAALGYHAIEGRWFSAAGEAVIGPMIARQARLRIGDTVTGGVVGGPSLRLRVVGLLNDFNAQGRGIRIGWETLAAAVPGSSPDTYLIRLRPGSDAKAYAKRVAAISPDFLLVAPKWAGLDGWVNLLSGMIGGLALVLALIAAAGVFNATWLSTRERIHDIAVLKGLGMTPGQIALMAVASTLVLTAVASLLGVPAGIWLQKAIWDQITGSYGVLLTIHVAPATLILALLGAFVVALAGAALPARCAAATPVAEVLRSE